VEIDRFGKLALGPEAVRRVTDAYEEALVHLGLNDVADTVTEEVARASSRSQRRVTDSKELAPRAAKDIRAT
jgi:hypothetical protein